MADITPRKTDIGPPHYGQFLPPVIAANYGKWKYHEIPRPGVLVHTAESGDKLYTVRAASPRLLSVQTIRDLCDLADKHCDGYLRFTSRHNIEFLLTDPSRIDPLIADLAAAGFPVGGIGNALSNIVHTQGWIHCHSAATDASGIVKALMDELVGHFTSMDLPGKLRIALACCVNMCGAVHCSDIAILGIHRGRRRCSTTGCQRSARCRRSSPPARPRPSAPCARKGASRWRWPRTCACSAATATRSARPCRSTTPSTTGSPSGWAAR